MNYLEILIAAIAAFTLGAAWYTVLFGKYWKRQTGVTDEMARKNLALTHGLALLAMLAYAYCVQTFWGAHFNEDPTFSHGAYHAARYGMMFALPAMIINYAYQKRSLGLFLVDAAYIMAIVVLMSALISKITLWQPAAEMFTPEELRESIEWGQDYIQKKQDALDALRSN